MHDAISGKMVIVVFSELSLSKHFVFIPWSFDISFDSHRTVLPTFVFVTD